MRAQPDCIPCTLKQAGVTAGRITGDPAVHEAIAREAAARIEEIGRDLTPAELATEIFRLVTGTLGVPDPFGPEKERYNREAMALYPRLRTLIAGSRDPLQTALLLAVAGNLIDLGIMEPMAVQEAVDGALARGLARDDLAALRRDLAGARSLLYAGDNAGEIAFDRLLIEEIKREFPQIAVTFAVKSGPASNDAMRRDAEAVGLPELAAVIETGGAALGVPRSASSPEFWRIFDESDVVISKGHANYETLDETAHPALYFLVTVKCAIVAGAIGVKVGDSVLVKNGGT